MGRECGAYELERERKVTQMQIIKHGVWLFYIFSIMSSAKLQMYLEKFPHGISFSSLILVSIYTLAP